MNMRNEQRNKNDQVQKDNENKEARLEELDGFIQERKAALLKRKNYLDEIR